jgi:hypothetical protein
MRGSGVEDFVQAMREERHFVSLLIPSGIGYLQWICNIATGHGFIASSYFEYYVVVQRGSSSSCLHNVTTTYSYASYSTTDFEAYTRNPPSASPTQLSEKRAKWVYFIPPLSRVSLFASVTAFPTGSFSTIAAK